MVIPLRKIVWDIYALNEFEKIIDYIKKDSPLAAKKVKSEIFEIIKKLPSNPLMFAKDALKENNDGSYRAFFAFSYRIAYKITEDCILILRIRHTSREPEQY